MSIKENDQDNVNEIPLPNEEYFPLELGSEKSVLFNADNHGQIESSVALHEISEAVENLIFIDSIGYISSFAWSTSVEHLLGSPLLEEGGISYEIALAGSDPKANDLHPEANSLYEKANTEYLKDQGRKYPHIKINSGVRSSTRQAELYIAYISSRYGGPAAPRANKPGKSNHEYGLAIDVFRKLDEQRLKKVLTDAGWTNNVKDEGWHFDAEAIPSWNSIQGEIANIASSLSDPFGNDVASIFEYEKKIKEKLPEHEEEQNELQLEQQRLIKEQSRLQSEQSRLQSEQSALKREISSFNHEVESLKRLRSRIQNFRFTYCPNGNVFNDCNHAAAKRRYVNERNKMVDNYNSRSSALQRRSQRLDARIKRFESDAKRFGTDAGRFEQDAKSFESRVEAFKKLTARIRKWIEARQKLVDSLPTKIAKIESAVAKVRAG